MNLCTIYLSHSTHSVFFFIAFLGLLSESAISWPQDSRKLFLFSGFAASMNQEVGLSA
jgi:hypothetical protein